MTNSNTDAEVKKTAAASRGKRGITISSTAEYFSKNLQQVGFSSPTKAVLTTVKEAVDNSLDACEENYILPDLTVIIEKKGAGSLRNTDKIRVFVQDNGPGIDVQDVPKVFGEYLASSKFGRGRCSRGQQGIGISAATTWALQTNAAGVRVITKKKNQRKALTCVVEMDLKNNKGVLKDKKQIDWDFEQGTSVDFLIDGRVQLNGEAGIINYLKGNVFVNPHMTLRYQLPGMDKVEVIERVTNECPQVPQAVEPHPHTMKLGEFLAHARLFGNAKTRSWLRKGFSRISDKILTDVAKNGKFNKKVYDQSLAKLTDTDFKNIYSGLQNSDLMAPSTSSVLSIGEEGLSKSILRIGEIDFFSVVTRKPTICDFKPIQIEVAVARLITKKSDEEDQVHVLRFANRVPLQFDKGACAIVKGINGVNWRNYGLRQPKNSIPLGPYIICVSMVSPFIKFKNASKETIDASDELVEEIRRALMQAGQRLSRHIRREAKELELEQRTQHIEKFGPILVEALARITGAPEKRKEAARQGLVKILGRDTKNTKEQLLQAKNQLDKQKQKRRERLGISEEEDQTAHPVEIDLDEEATDLTPIKKAQKPKSKKTKPKPKAKPKKKASKAKSKKPAKTKAKTKKKKTAKKPKAKSKKTKPKAKAKAKKK